MTAPSKPSLRLIASVFDCPEPRSLAEFYGRLLAWEIDEAESEEGWVDLVDPASGTTLAFQRDPHYLPPTWPARERPQMMHLDIRVSSLDEGHERAIEAGAAPLPQPADQKDASFRVYADPDGHPFCLCSSA